MSLYAFFVVLLLSVPSWAATYYVSPGASGSGCSPTDSAGTNRSTITAGLTCLGAGDTLVIHGGTYPEDVRIFGGGTNWTTGLKTVKAAPQETVLIPHLDWVCDPCYVEVQGLIVDNAVSGGPGTVTCIHGNSSSFYRMRNVEARGGQQGYLTGDSAHDLEILGFHSHHHGITTGGTVICPEIGLCHGLYGNGYNMLISGGDLHHNNGYGIQFRTGHPDLNITINNNKFHDNTSGGIIAFTGVYNFYNNLSYSNGTGVWIVGVGGTSRIYQNTVYGNFGGEGGIFVRNDPGNENVEIINNISYNNNININIESGSTSVTQASNTTTDPGFAGAQFANFHITSQFSPANVPPGQTLGPPWNFDAENRQRPDGGYTKGAFQFASSTPPSPATLALYKADGNANDSGGHASGPFNGALTSGALANGAPIVSGNSFVFNGTGAYVNVTGTSTLRPPAIGMALWLNSTTPPVDEACNAIRMGNAWSMGWDQNGRAFCWINFGPTAAMTTGSVLTGTNQMLACGYDPVASGAGIRLWQGNSLVDFELLTTAISYSGSENLTIGGNPSGGFNCAGRIDEVRVANFAWQQSDIDSMFGAVTPAVGRSMTHQRYSVANASEGNWIGNEDTDQALVVTQPWGQRWSLHNASDGPTTENYRPFCRINHLGVWGAWTELTNSFGSFGLRYLTDTAVNVGDPTTPLLTLDGFTGVPGKFFADVVTVGTGFPTSQKIALATGQHAEQEIRLQAGSPVVAGDLIQCRPYHESGSVLSGGYGTGDVNILTLTMLAVIAPATARVGGTIQGGTVQ